jgi:hypothetical protein
MEKLVGTLDGIKQGYENPVVENALDRTLQTSSFIDRLPARLHSIFRDNYREELAQLTGPAKVFINTNSGLVHRALLMAMVCPNVRSTFLFLEQYTGRGATREQYDPARSRPRNLGC